MINVTTVKLLLNGIDYNPYFIKYTGSFGDSDGIPIHNIIVSFQGKKI
jgi:hypothetical protein